MPEAVTEGAGADQRCDREVEQVFGADHILDSSAAVAELENTGGIPRGTRHVGRHTVSGDTEPQCMIDVPGAAGPYHQHILIVESGNLQRGPAEAGAMEPLTDKGLLLCERRQRNQAERQQREKSCHHRSLRTSGQLFLKNDLARLTEGYGNGCVEECKS